MTKKITSQILEYAKYNKNFGIDALLSHLKCESGIKKSTISWILYQLVQSKKLARVARGIYTLQNKQIFIPKISDTTKSLYAKIKIKFPFSKFCLYEGDCIAPLLHHLAPNQLIYVEVERDSIETVFNFLKTEEYNVFLKPDKYFFYRYIDMNKRAIIVKTLISEAPIQKISSIPSITIEKLLVDVQKDSDFFYLQGYETMNIIKSAFSIYSINVDKMLRYASRRGLRLETVNILKELDIR